jgi:hypothetical protein
VRFTQELLIAYHKFLLSHIVNAEELNWLVFWPPRKTVAEKGVESLKVEINGYEKLARLQSVR